MATIAVVTSSPPLTDGGHLVHARALERALKEAGHRAGIVTTPSNRFGRQGAAYLANWLTDVGQMGDGARVDQIISMRYPSYAVRHPRHVCWLIHTMREYYDLWDDFQARLSPQGRIKEGVRRRLIHAADTYCFKHHVTKLFTNSAAVNDRLQRWNGVSGEVLHPPPPQRPYRCESYGDYVFFYSRLTPLKRGDLFLRALSQPVAAGIKAVIAGDGDDRPRLEQLAKDLNLIDRVRFVGPVGEADLLDHLARCRAVVFVPFQEDYGFVTGEAFSAGKPVVTCTDSGGPLELARHRENALIVSPDSSSLAKACAELAQDASLAETLGRNGRAAIAPLTWEAAVRRLVLIS